MQMKRMKGTIQITKTNKQTLKRKLKKGNEKEKQISPQKKYNNNNREKQKRKIIKLIKRNKELPSVA